MRLREIFTKGRVLAGLMVASLGASLLGPAVAGPRIARFFVHAASPNPFFQGTRIQLELPSPQPLVARVFDLSGRRIRTLVRDNRNPGDHVVTWDGTDETGSRVRSGMYFYQLVSGGDSSTRKMTLVK